MKRLWLLLVLASVSWAAPPDCLLQLHFTNRAGDLGTIGQQLINTVPGVSPSFNNNLIQCTAWSFSYDSEGFSAISIVFQSAPNSFSTPVFQPGTFVTFAGTTVAGSNPSTTTTSALYTATGYYPYVRAALSTLTGTGSINVTIQGWRSPNFVASSGGSSSRVLLLQGVIQAGVVGFSANLPAASSPLLCPASANCVNTVGTVSMPVLEWPTAQSTYYAWWSWELGSDYVSNSAVSYIVEYFSADSTHAAILTPSWSCGTTGSPNNPTFTGDTPANLTAGAASGRTISAALTFTPTCSAGNRLWLKVVIDTNTNSLTSAFDLISIRCYTTGLI